MMHIGNYRQMGSKTHTKKPPTRLCKQCGLLKMFHQVGSQFSVNIS